MLPSRLPSPADQNRYWDEVLGQAETLRPPRRLLEPGCSIDPELARDAERLGALVAGPDTDVGWCRDTEWYPPGFFLDELMRKLERDPAAPLAALPLPEGYLSALTSSDDEDEL